jgi:hypothetical protein
MFDILCILIELDCPNRNNLMLRMENFLCIIYVVLSSFVYLHTFYFLDIFAIVCI